MGGGKGLHHSEKFMFKPEYHTSWQLEEAKIGMWTAWCSSIQKANSWDLYRRLKKRMPMRVHDLWTGGNIVVIESDKPDLLGRTFPESYSQKRIHSWDYR